MTPPADQDLITINDLTVRLLPICSWIVEHGGDFRFDGTHRRNSEDTVTIQFTILKPKPTDAEIAKMIGWEGPLP